MCVNVGNDIRTRGLFEEFLDLRMNNYYSYPAGIYHAIYLGVKLRCSKPHEFILAWDKSSITRNNFIPAIEQS